jgi:hypothetical protein
LTIPVNIFTNNKKHTSCYLWLITGLTGFTDKTDRSKLSTANNLKINIQQVLKIVLDTFMH